MQKKCLRGFDLEQIDIAPTIANVLKIPFQSDGRPVKGIVAYGEGCNQILLVVIDAFGYSQYLKSKRFFQNIWKMGCGGRLYRCKANADKTTPAIASILCGRKPEVHKIYNTGDVYKSYIKSILEIASEQGIRSAVVMEEEGALTFGGRIDIVKPVKDREDIIEFDGIVKEATIESIKEDAHLIVTHLRALDKLGYTLEAIKSVDKNVLEIAKAYETNGLIMLCGDHPPHESKECLVPLIASRVA
ncbi:MAG: hypothetical protein HXX80_04010 [Nitrososphaerales archaeon]|nr:hypothetical protein [Nitrososphaerales archaeon]